MARKLLLSLPVGALVFSFDSFPSSAALYLRAAHIAPTSGDDANLSQPYLVGGFGLTPSSHSSFLQKGLFGRRKKGDGGNVPWPSHQTRSFARSSSSDGPSTGSQQEETTGPADPFADILAGPSGNSGEPRDPEGTAGFRRGRRGRGGGFPVDPVRVGSTVRKGADQFQENYGGRGEPIPINRPRYTPGGKPIQSQEGLDPPTPRPSSGPKFPQGAGGPAPGADGGPLPSGHALGDGYSLVGAPSGNSTAAAEVGGSAGRGPGQGSPVPPPVPPRDPLPPLPPRRSPDPRRKGPVWTVPGSSPTADPPPVPPRIPLGVAAGVRGGARGGPQPPRGSPTSPPFPGHVDDSEKDPWVSPPSPPGSLPPLPPRRSPDPRRKGPVWRVPGSSPTEETSPPFPGVQVGEAAGVQGGAGGGRLPPRQSPPTSPTSPPEDAPWVLSGPSVGGIPTLPPQGTPPQSGGPTWTSPPTQGSPGTHKKPPRPSRSGAAVAPAGSSESSGGAQPQEQDEDSDEGPPDFIPPPPPRRP